MTTPIETGSAWKEMVPPTVREVAGALSDIKPIEADFVQARLCRRLGMAQPDGRVWAMIAGETRKATIAENPMANAASNRLEGLIHASNRLTSIVGDQELRQLPNFSSVVTEIGRGLADSETLTHQRFASAVEATPLASDMAVLADVNVAALVTDNELEQQYINLTLLSNRMKPTEAGYKSFSQLQTTAAVELRRQIDPENFMSARASDRLSGLLLASDRIAQLAGDTDLGRYSGFIPELAKVADGLANKETAFYASVREQASQPAS